MKSCSGWFDLTSILITEAWNRRHVVLDIKTYEASEDLTAAADIQRHRFQLQRHLVAFRKMQLSYMPPVNKLLLEHSGATDDGFDVEETKLWLPSQLNVAERNGCSKGLVKKEEFLREAQCWDALERIRMVERAKLSIVEFCNRHLRGQAQNAQAHGAFTELRRKSQLTVTKYQHARKALMVLRGPGDWELQLRMLSWPDIRGPASSIADIDEPGSEMNQNGRLQKKKHTALEKKTAERQALEDVAQTGQHLGEGSREVSWIWMDPAALQAAAADTSRHEGEFVLESGHH